MIIRKSWAQFKQIHIKINSEPSTNTYELSMETHSFCTVPVLRHLHLLGIKTCMPSQIPVLQYHLQGFLPEITCTFWTAQLGLSCKMFSLLLLGFWTPVQPLNSLMTIHFFSCLFLFLITSRAFWNVGRGLLIFMPFIPNTLYWKCLKLQKKQQAWQLHISRVISLIIIIRLNRQNSRSFEDINQTKGMLLGKKAS